MSAFPSASTPSSAATAASFSAALRASRQARVPTQSPWLRLAVVVALLAIAVQLVAMAQLAQHQVQRGVQLRQTIAAERAGGPAMALAADSEQPHAAPLQTASSYPQDREGRMLVVQASN